MSARLDRRRGSDSVSIVGCLSNSTVLCNQRAESQREVSNQARTRAGCRGTRARHGMAIEKHKNVEESRVHHGDGRPSKSTTRRGCGRLSHSLLAIPILGFGCCKGRTGRGASRAATCAKALALAIVSPRFAARSRHEQVSFIHVFIH